MNINVVSKKIAFILTCAGLTVACTNTPTEHKQKIQQNFSVTQSVLQKDPTKPATDKMPEVQSNIGEQNFSDQSIDSLATLQRGSPLLTAIPSFATSKPIQVAVNELTVPQLVHYVFEQLLGISYVVAPEVERMQERVALNIREEVNSTELFTIVRQVLSQQSVQLHTKDNIVYVSRLSGRNNVERSVGIGRELDDMPQSGDDVLQLVPYTYNSARSIMSIVSKLSNVQAYPENNHRLLVIEGKRAEVERALQVVNMLDVPHARGRDIRLLSLVYLSPDALLTQMQTIMMAEGILLGDDVALVPINRLNAMVVYASNRTLGDRISMWAKTLDVPTGGEAERFYVYRPQFAKAVDLAKSVQAILPQSMLGAGNESAAGGRASSSAAPSQLRISADETQNALIISASPSRYQDILVLLQQLDRLPGQVALQVVVAEVELSDNVNSGIDWFYNSAANAGQGAQLDLRSSLGSLNFAGFRGDWRMALQLLATKTDIRVLSRPYLVVRDGESASINSGQQVPIITEFRDNESNGSVRTSVQYRSTGISLSVTPVINADGLVSLDISQETSKSEPNTTSDISSPTISSRSLRTQVLAGNGQTVILGGLIKEDLTNNDTRVPILGDIPGLGRLFTTKGSNFSRSELIVLITPRIIRDTGELDDLGRKLSELYSFPVEP